ncbi:MAG: NADH-quinone oxidoreductase subunit M [Bacteroidetes bacterium]|nr:NADH-quinone oxidoreductase subunit M [Bacteroidota bacterium]
MTLLLLGIPLLAALILLVAKGSNLKNLALSFSLVEFVVSVYAWFLYRQEPSSSVLSFDAEWIKSIGAHFDVSINALSLLMILLTNFLIPLIILSSYRKGYALSNKFYGFILLMQMALVGVFMANDGFLFYVFWEVALIPIYFICLLWGSEGTARVTLKFFIYTFLGSLFMLVGLLYLYNHTGVDGTKSWNVNELYLAGKSMNVKEQSAVFWSVFVAFAIKMPIVPFHTWQPDTYVTAPTQGTMLLSGIMLKMASFGLLKWLIPAVPLGLEVWGHTALMLCVIGIIYTSIIAIGQKDYKRFIAYASVAHVAVIAAGALSLNQQGIQGSIMLMLAHGVNAVGLFFVVEILIRYAGTSEIPKLGGIRNLNSNFGMHFFIIMLGVVAIPLTNGFIGEFLSLNGLYQYSPVMAGFAGLSIIFGAVYMLRTYQHIMLGEVKDTTLRMGTLEASEKITLAIISLAVLAMGVYPAPLNEIAETAANEILMHIK